MGLHEFAKGLDEAMLRCRDIGHWWDLETVTVLRFESTVSGYLHELVCMRGCGAKRKRWLSHQGAVTRGHHLYKSSYLYDGGRMDSKDRNIIRLETTSRVIAPSGY